MLISKVTNSAVIMLAVPIYNNEQIVGALIARIPGTALNDFTDKLGVGERGYVFVVGSDSTIYAHPKKDLVKNKINVYDEINTNGELKGFGIALKELGIQKSGIIKYNYDGKSRITAITPISGTNWTLAIGNYESDILKPVNNLKNAIIIATIVVIIIGTIVGSFLGLFIVKPIKILLVVIEKMSKYDLTSDISKKDLKILKRSDEIGIIANAVAIMKKNLTQLLQSVAQNSEQVAASSEELTANT